MRSEDEFAQAAAKPGPDCLTPEQLSAPLDPNKARHVASCPRCRAEAELLGSFLEEEAGHGERADVDWLEGRLRALQPGLPPKRRWWEIGPGARVAYGAAAAVLLVTIGVQWQRQRLLNEAEAPGAGAGITRSAGRMEPPGEWTAGMSALPRRLDWKPVAGAASYEIEFQEVDGTTVWKAAAPAPGWELPEELRGKLEPNRPFTLTIRARGGEPERELASTGAVRFRVTAPPAQAPAR